jgi:DNA-binding FadR family transcriptional regulator
LIELWSSLNGQIGALVLRSLEEQHAQIEDVAAFHERLLDAIASGEPDIAKRGVMDHYVRVEDRVAVRNELIQQITGTLAGPYQEDFHPRNGA